MDKRKLMRKITLIVKGRNRTMKNTLEIFKKALFAPIAFCCGALADIDGEELTRIVEKRTARAENAVLRDYFAQHGVEGEEAEEAMEEFRRKRKAAQPSAQELSALREKLQQAEKQAKRASAMAHAKLGMVRMGIPEEHFDDVMTLVIKDIGDDADEETVKNAVEAVINRLPGFGESGRYTAGSKGNFARSDSHAVMQQQLDAARAAGNNAAAVAIISHAAVKGIKLR